MDELIENIDTYDKIILEDYNKLHSRKRGWIFVLKNYSKNEHANIKSIIERKESIRYIIYICEKVVSRLYGYVHFYDGVTYKSVKKHLGNRVFITWLNGTSSCILNYIKSKNKYEEYGIIPKQGIRKSSSVVEIKINKEYKCQCGKTYKYRQGLSTHNKNCNYVEGIKNNLPSQLEKLEYENEILKLKNKILEMTKDSQLMKESLNSIQLNNNINNNTTNTNTNSFNTINKNNIKIFLSEKCANAISIQDFVTQLTISLDDIVKAKDNTAKGITDIIERNLKPFSITTRPVHSIEKNEWYMKDNQEWKEDDGNTLITKAHRKIQKEGLKAYSDLGHPEEQVEVAAFATSDLTQAHAAFIKEQIANACRIAMERL